MTSAIQEHLERVRLLEEQLQTLSSQNAEKQQNMLQMQKEHENNILHLNTTHE